MANITRFDPFKELARIDPFGGIDDLFKGFMVRPVFQGMPTITQFKLDVSEELTRLHAHLERLRDLLEIGTDAGRRLDFTLQECFREIATCGNKIQDAQTSRLVVDFKNELEKCREQVQNLE